MFPSLLLLLFLAVSIPTTVDAVIDVPLSLRRQPHFLKPAFSRRDGPPEKEEYIEVTRPLPYDSLKPSCTLHVLSHTFANTINLPPTTTNYSAPRNCKWSRALLQLSGSSNGSQYDRIAAVWLSGAEILRTSTPEPTPEGIFWNVEKDVTRYASLLRHRNLTLAVMLENVVNDVYTGLYRIKLTFLYYDIEDFGADGLTLSLLPAVPDPETGVGSFDLDENPADLIFPISATGDEGGFWFTIENGLDAIYQGIKIPLNTYRAVIELYVSSHGNDEFWYSNPPDAYIIANNLTTNRGNGAFREILVKIDDNIVASVFPFPVIFTGGINPLFWEPIVSIGAFNLPSYEIDLTPLLGILLDGEEHFLGLSVADAIPFWLLDANLHLWLDHGADEVQAGAIRYRHPNTCVQRYSQFLLLDGGFDIEAKRESEFSGWVNSSAGNFTIDISTKLSFHNTLNFSSNGTEKSVKQEISVKSEMRIVDNLTGAKLVKVENKYKYPLKVKTSNFPGSRNDSYLLTTKLEHSLKQEEKREIGRTKKENSLENKQKVNGWMFVQDHDVLSGMATTSQKYETEDKFGCYSRNVVASHGAIQNDTERFVCASAQTW